MPTNLGSRFTLIAVILLGALWCVFPGMFKGNLHPDLRPGIDMVGGTSLLYEIKTADGSTGPAAGNLAEEVMKALKRRVDPDGVRNLIWRPQGNTRLEIQMPLTANSAQVQQKREAFSEAQKKLQDTNVRQGEVLHAVETLTGDARRDRLNQLAMGSDERGKVFGALASVWDQLQTAKQQKNAAVQADKEIEYDTLKAKVDDTNLTSAALESALNAPDGQQKLADLKKRYADFPLRLQAIDQFAKANTDYQQVRGSLEDSADLKRLLRGSGVLEFHILMDMDRSNPTVQQMVQRLKTRGPVVEANDQMRWYVVDQPEEFKAQAVEYNGKYYVLAYTTPERSMTNHPGQAPWALTKALATQDPNSGERIVSFQFDPQGAKYFGELTANNSQRALGIVLDERMISAPNVHEPIRGGSGMISGNKQQGGFSAKEQSYLVSMLSAGSLPARLTDEPISERTVGPQLGQDNLRAGLLSCLVGAILVVVFMIGYYYLSGVVACVALLMNIILILGIMAALNATFTLPGVAAIVLTIGMAVDANVLIYERLREELERGLSVRMALRNAYDRAASAIFDGNITTAITSIALYVMGSEEVKGFGLTLLIGIGCSLFTALFVTKTIFAWLLDRGVITNLGSVPQTFPRWQKFLHPNFDWMGKAWIFYAFSAIFIGTGLALFVVKVHKGEMLDIEFASGTSVEFELKQPMAIKDVRSLIDNIARQRPHELPAPSVYSVGTNGLGYEVVTANPTAAEVRKAVLDALGDRLKTDLPSTFDNYDQTASTVIGKTILPIDTAQTQIPGAPEEKVRSHVGGAAILLNNLNPPLAPAEIKARISRMQGQPGLENVPYREFDVVTETGREEPTNSAVILISDPALPHDQDAAKWEMELVTPTWKMITEAIHSEAKLQKVSNFDAQVAGETAREAMLALAMSIVGIMAYIWVRFGNLKYGTATVVALLHDVLFTVAAIGFSHYVVEFPAVGHFFSNVLLIEPFRINLTIIAAILTVMGYSMNDTVVVFDRIRENRGKFGAASRTVINDSINQTLSRTLLTSGCTLVTVTTMYFLGGPGIHGFTYCLLLGILVGTYSSVAIAAPILLLGKHDDTGGAGGAGAVRKSQPVGQLQRA